MQLCKLILLIIIINKVLIVKSAKMMGIEEEFLIGRSSRRNYEMLFDSCIYLILIAILMTYLPLLKQMEGNTES